MTRGGRRALLGGIVVILVVAVTAGAVRIFQVQPQATLVEPARSPLHAASPR